MPDIGLTEIALVGILAIIVVKPEEWPTLLRKVGYYYGILHRYLLSAKSQSRQLYNDITTLADENQSIEEFIEDDGMDGHEDPEEEYTSDGGMNYDARTKWERRFTKKHRRGLRF